MTHRRDLVSWLLVALAVLSAAGIVYLASGYVRATRMMQEIEVRLTDLSLLEGPEPAVLLTFHLDNGAPVSLAVQDWRLSLYLGRSYMGSNYAPFIQQDVPAMTEAELRFQVPINEVYRSLLEEARASGTMDWSARGVVNIAMPYGFAEKIHLLRFDEAWGGP